MSLGDPITPGEIFDSCGQYIEHHPIVFWGAAVVAGIGTLVIKGAGVYREHSWQKGAVTRAALVREKIVQPPAPTQKSSDDRATATAALTFTMDMEKYLPDSREVHPSLLPQYEEAPQPDE